MLGAVLIMVDASGVVSPSLVRIIKRSGYDSLAVENGEQDLRQYCDHPDVAALFLNLNTLVIGGMEFLEALRSYFADVGRSPVSGVSTETEVSSRLNAISLWVHDYAMKPYDETIIKSKLAIAGCECQP